MTPALMRSGRATAIGFAAAGIVGIGSVAMFGWIVDEPALATWKAGTVPMAPATAALSVLFGAALWRGARDLTDRGQSSWPASIYAWAGLLAAIGLLALRLTDTYWPGELLGLRLSGPSVEPTTGFVSPITAVSVALANVTLLLAVAPDRGRHGMWLVRGLSGLIAAGGFVLVLTALFGPPLLVSEGILPVAVNTSAVLLCSGCGLLALVVPRFGGPPAVPGDGWQGSHVLFAIFVSVTGLTIAGSFAYYRLAEGELRREAEVELDTVSQLTARQVTAWRRERAFDASMVSGNPAFARVVSGFLQRPDHPAARRELDDWLGRYVAYTEYDAVFLVDVHGGALFSLNAGQRAAPKVLAEVAGVVRSRRPAIADFYVDEQDGRVHLATLVPVMDGIAHQIPIAVLILRIDPVPILYPLIGYWPSASASAESLLVRRIGSEVEFLNPLRFDREAALRRRIPMDDDSVLAVKAVQGQSGLVSGLDYRGAPVIGVLRHIPDSPWYLVARKDVAEFRSGLWERFWVVSAFATIVLMFAGAGLGMVWRDQRARFYRSEAALAKQLLQSEERYRRYVESATDSVFELNPAGLITFVSPNWPDLMGEPASEALGKPLERYVHPDDVARGRAYLAKTLEGQGPAEGIEYRTLQRDGTVRWHSVRGAALRDPDGHVFGGMGIARDITERVDAVRKAAEIKERLELATRAAGIGIWDWDVVTNAIIWDEKMYQLYGLTVNSVEIDYDRWLAGVHPDDRLRVDGDVREALPGTASYASEFRAVWPDGTVRKIAAVGRVTIDGGGQPVRMLGVNYDVTDRWVAEERLRSLLLEKEALLREVHHRVKNNLQVITSLLRLEAERAGQSTTVHVLREMQDRIHAMASLHESLYRSNELERVNLADYLRRLAMQLFNSSSVEPGTIELGFDLDAVYVEIHEAIPCGLLVNELVSNSLKHGFPDSRTGAILIELHLIDGGPALRLTVKDNGVGLPADVDARRAGSLGLQLVADLARQLHGVLETAPGPGAAFCLAFTPEGAHSSGVSPRSA
ncbi:MAG: PAS domain-containing protein [Vicinamibacterales bacterium]